MRKLAVVVWLAAGVGCTSSSSSTDQSAALIGEWSGQGFTVENPSPPTAPAPSPPGTERTFGGPSLVSFRGLAFTADASGVVHLSGVYPVAAVSPEAIPMIGFGGPILYVDGPFTVSGPAYASCANTSCQDQTDAVTVTGGSASVAPNGQIWVALAGQRMNCCQPETYTVAFIGTPASGSTSSLAPR
jgi:hypothetical protein